MKRSRRGGTSGLSQPQSTRARVGWHALSAGGVGQIAAMAQCLSSCSRSLRRALTGPPDALAQVPDPLGTRKEHPALFPSLRELPIATLGNTTFDLPASGKFHYYPPTFPVRQPVCLTCGCTDQLPNAIRGSSVATTHQYAARSVLARRPLRRRRARLVSARIGTTGGRRLSELHAALQVRDRCREDAGRATARCRRRDATFRRCTPQPAASSRPRESAGHRPRADCFGRSPAHGSTGGEVRAQRLFVQPGVVIRHGRGIACSLCRQQQRANCRGCRHGPIVRDGTPELHATIARQLGSAGRPAAGMGSQSAAQPAAARASRLSRAAASQAQRCASTPARVERFVPLTSAIGAGRTVGATVVRPTAATSAVATSWPFRLPTDEHRWRERRDSRRAPPQWLRDRRSRTAR